MALVEAVDEQIPNRRNKAMYYMDKLFPFYVGEFDIGDAIGASDLPDEERKLAHKLWDDIQVILLNEEHYAERYQNSIYLKLSGKGLKAQRKGGHFKYLEYLEELDKPKLTSITYNKMRDNYGNAAQGNQDSRFEGFENTAPPITTPTNTQINTEKKGVWLKMWNWSINNIGKILISVIATIIATYLLIKFGWKK